MIRIIVILIYVLIATDAKAAFWKGQTYLPPAVSQITCAMGTGIASVGGPCTTPPALGVCNGDLQTITRTISINTGTKNLNTTVNTFTSGDVNKAIVIPQANGGGTLTTTITAFTDAQNVTLNSAPTTLSSVSRTFNFGNNDTPVFQQFNTWALANQGSSQVVQNFTTSSSCWFATQVVGGFISWTAGIKNLLVEGNGSTLNGLTVPWYVGSTSGAICSKGLTEVTGCTARIQTVSAGSSTIQLTSASLAAGYISRFSATPGANGNWILVSGLNPQEVAGGGSGYPPNPTYFDWRQITNINAGTGVITLDRPLTYDYLSTWPSYSTGTSVDSDPGGPATIYAMNDAWNVTLEFKNLTLMKDDQLAGNGRFVTYRGVSFNGSIPRGATNNCGAYPSMNEIFAAYNTDWVYCTIESDKITTSMILDTVLANRVDFQSNSIVDLTMSNSTVTNGMYGTAQNNTITDSTITLFRPGSAGYGNSNKTICTRCNVTTFETTGGVSQNSISNGDYSMSGGVISFANSDVVGASPPSRVFSPVRANLFYQVGSGGYGDTIGLIQAQAITQDPTNTYIQTNEVGGFPTWTSTTLTGLRGHPASQWTCDSCTGNFSLVATNIQNGATPLAPLGSYSSATFAPTSAQGNLGTFSVYGKLISATIDVTQAYSGSGAAVLAVTSRFNNAPTVKQSDWSAWTWGPIINLKQAGTRVITPGGVTCNAVPGPCAGDTINGTTGYPPEAVWVRGVINPWMESVLSAGTQPQFTMTFQTNQGVVPQ